MRRVLPILCCVIALAVGAKGAEQAPAWKLGSQAYTFRNLTFFETIDVLQSMGVHYVEAYPGQRISKEIDTGMNVGLDPEVESQVMAKLKAADMHMIAFGVCGVPQDEQGAREFFRRAKAMGIKTIVCEAAPEQLPMLDTLCAQFDMQVALHNHPAPASRYWHPDTVLEACKGLSSRIGACADVGHWVRSGLDPVASLHKLEGRIIELHFKDLNEQRNDVPWGTGLSNADAMLLELYRQGFSGGLLAEYEHMDDKLQQNVAQCMAYAAAWTPAAARERIAANAAIMSPNVSAVWSRVRLDGTGAWTDDDMKREEPKPTMVKLGDARIITANGPGFDNEGPENAFDGKTDTKYCVGFPTLWLQVAYPKGTSIVASAYAITSANDAPGRDPKVWRLLGSADGEKWTELDSRKNESFPERFTRREFTISKPTAFRFYKLDVTENGGDVSSQLAEWTLITSMQGMSAAAPTAPATLPAPAASERDLDGFVPLLKPDLSNAMFTAGEWNVRDGVLIGTAEKSAIWTKDAYGDFTLDLDFRVEGGGDGGIFLRCSDTDEWLQAAIEVQATADNTPGNRSCGAVVGCQAPATQVAKPAGEWNHCTIVAKGNLIKVVLNGVPVVDMDLDRWTQAGFNPDGSANPFETAYQHMPRKGAIGLQCWTPSVSYRCIQIKPL